MMPLIVYSNDPVKFETIDINTPLFYEALHLWKLVSNCSKMTHCSLTLILRS